jgi:hypothetical protein
VPNGRRIESLPQLLLGLLALAVAIVVGAFTVSSAVKAVKRSRDTITVTGSAREPITANLVTWNLSVHAEDAAPAKASHRLQSGSGEVRAFLENGGLGDEISEPPLSTEETTEKRSGKRVTVYRLTQSFRITSSHIGRVETVAGDVSRLFEQGVPVSVEPLEYVSTQLKQARVDALRAATADAQRRAKTLVEGLDSHLGSARKADVGVFQITPRNSTDVSDYGINDTSARQKDVVAVVTVTFALKG